MLGRIVREAIDLKNLSIHQETTVHHSVRHVQVLGHRDDLNSLNDSPNQTQTARRTKGLMPTTGNLADLNTRQAISPTETIEIHIRQIDCLTKNTLGIR